MLSPKDDQPVKMLSQVGEKQPCLFPYLADTGGDADNIRLMPQDLVGILADDDFNFRRILLQIGLDISETEIIRVSQCRSQDGFVEYNLHGTTPLCFRNAHRVAQ